MVPRPRGLTTVSQHETYYSYLIDLMNYVKNPEVPFNKQSTFADEELLTLTDQDVFCWLAMKSYGVPNPTADDNPTLARSNTLQYAKKAVSFFMPNKNTQWNVALASGNPTKSVLVNGLIKAVKKKEVRKEGKASQARRPLTMEEFKQLVKLLHAKTDPVKRYVLTTMIKFQFHMVGRIDDTSRFLMEDLKPNPNFNFALLGRLCWSKNVREERDAPDQILLGSADPLFCVLIGLALHLEVFLQGDGQHTPYVFGIGGDNGDDAAARRTKDRASAIIKEVFESDEFVLAIGMGNLGTHSIRKLPTTHARRNGCSRDDLDVRGRWKKAKRQVDTYIDVDLPFPDAKVAASLCIGGPIKYDFKSGSGLTNGWIVENITPHINSKFGASISLILGKALLWATFHDNTDKWLPPTMKSRIQIAYEQIRRLDIGVNPIVKVPLIVSGYEGTLFIDEIEDMEASSDENEGSTNRGSTNRGSTNRVRQTNELLALYSQLSNLNRQCTDIKAEIENMRLSYNDRLQKINHSIRRINFFPRAVRQTQQTNEEESTRNTSQEILPTLVKCPKTLNVLWQEWEFGLNGRKAAKDFTARERGNVRFTYHRRKVFWEKVSELIRA